MKHSYTLITALLISLSASAQSVFWTEDFGTGCNRSQVANAYTGTNGAWTVASTGQNDAHADLFFVSATAAGTGAGNCSDNCIFGNNTNQSLHIGNSAISMIIIGSDTGSTYLTGFYCGTWGICSNTHKRAQSPLINCTGHSNVSISFVYYEGGEGLDDNATLEYSADGGVTWTVIDQLAKTITNCTAVNGIWNTFSTTLPASANNNPNVMIGFQWTNDNDSQGADPSFAVDDVTLTDGPSNIAGPNTSELSVYASGSAIVIEPGIHNYRLLNVSDVLGRTINAAAANNRINMPGASGVYFVTLEVGGKRVVKKLLLSGE